MEEREKKNSSRKQLSYMEERELAQLEKSIPEAEALVAEREKEFSDPQLFSSRPKDVPKVQVALQEARSALEALYERWEELEEKKEKLLQNKKT